MSCSRTQRSASDESQTSDLPIPSLILYHCAPQAYYLIADKREVHFGQFLERLRKNGFTAVIITQESFTYLGKF